MLLTTETVIIAPKGIKKLKSYHFVDLSNPLSLQSSFIRLFTEGTMVKDQEWLMLKKKQFYVLLSVIFFQFLQVWQWNHQLQSSGRIE